MAYIVSKVPLRVSLLGGGADVGNVCSNENWECNFLGFSIDKYIYISSTSYPEFLSKKIRLLYSQVEEVEEYKEIKHPVFRNILKKYGISYINFMVSSDIPAGCGLGSSSAFTAGLIANCWKIIKKEVSNENIAKEAIFFEQKVLNEKVGVQDQIICSLGGINIYTFKNPNDIITHNIEAVDKLAENISSNSFLLFTGKLRRSSEYQEDFNQNTKTDSRLEYEEVVSRITSSAIKELKNGLLDVDALFEEYVRPAWIAKRNYLAENNQTEIINLSLKLDSLGIRNHRLCGSGGGGFYYIKTNSKKDIDVIYNNFRKEYILPVRISHNGIKTSFIDA